MIRSLFCIVMFVLFPVQVQAASWCKMDKPIDVRILPSMSQLKYDYSKSFVDLSRMRISSENPYGSKAITHTFGIANGQFNIEHQAQFQVLTNPNTGETCMWYDFVEVNLKMHPTIFIAKEYKKGGCHFKEVMAHERQHIAVDKQITNEYSQILARALMNEVSKTPLYGPFPSSQKAATQKKMEKRLQDIVSKHNDAMMADRSQRQAKIDSKTNYDAISKKLHDVCDKKSPMTAKRVQRKL